jgi:hypothetical protein
MMGKAACTFKQSDVTRAFKAAKKAGVDVQVQINQETKTITITPVKVIESGECHPKSETTGEGDWDNIQ